MAFIQGDQNHFNQTTLKRTLQSDLIEGLGRKTTHYFGFCADDDGGVRKRQDGGRCGQRQSVIVDNASDLGYREACEGLHRYWSNPSVQYTLQQIPDDSNF